MWWTVRSPYRGVCLGTTVEFKGGLRVRRRAARGVPPPFLAPHDATSCTLDAAGVCDDGGMLVWLTDWQIAEDHLLIEVGDSVEWTVYPADRDWVWRLFGDRLAIDWQLDSYGEAVEQPSRRVSGRVAELSSVRCRRERAPEGRFRLSDR